MYAHHWAIKACSSTGTPSLAFRFTPTWSSSFGAGDKKVVTGTFSLNLKPILSNEMNHATIFIKKISPTCKYVRSDTCGLKRGQFKACNYSYPDKSTSIYLASEFVQAGVGLRTVKLTMPDCWRVIKNSSKFLHLSFSKSFNSFFLPLPKRMMWYHSL